MGATVRPSPLILLSSLASWLPRRSRGDRDQRRSAPPAALPRSLRSWPEDLRVLRGVVVAYFVALFVLSGLGALPGVRGLTNWVTVALLCFVGIWLTEAILRRKASPETHWQRDVSRLILTTWPEVALRCGASVRDGSTGGQIYPGLGHPRVGG